MDWDVATMEAQLERWSLKIDHLVAKTQIGGVPAGFDALMHIDELKALHAIAESKLIEFKTAGGSGREGLRAGMKSAWNDLEAAFKTRPGKGIDR